MNQEQKCTQLLQIGVQHKRNGDLEKALNYYGQAFNEYPLNKDIYKNCAKIYMAVGQPDHAMRNLLTYSQITINNGNVNMESYDFAVPFYDWSGYLNNKIKVQKDIALTAVAQNFNLAKIVADLNLTFQAGFCFIIKNRNNLTNVQIPVNLLNNYIKSLLGQPTDGPTLADTNGASMVRAIGLSYLLVNFITNPNLPIEELIDAYLNEDFDLDNF
jgi:tetratricopeptide (TPR) repeat protein